MSGARIGDPRERGGVLFKGRFDVDADWELVLGAGGQCIIIADLGDMAVVRLGDAVWHHWVRREAGRIAFEVLIADEGDLGDDKSKLSFDSLIESLLKIHTSTMADRAAIEFCYINSKSSRKQLSEVFS